MYISPIGYDPVRSSAAGIPYAERSALNPVTQGRTFDTYDRVSHVTGSSASGDYGRQNGGYRLPERQSAQYVGDREALTGPRNLNSPTLGGMVDFTA